MNTKKIIAAFIASLVMSGSMSVVSFAETASKAPTTTAVSSKTTEKKDDAKKKVASKTSVPKTTIPAVVAGKAAATTSTAAVGSAAKTGTVKNVAAGDFRGNPAEHIFHKSSCRFYSGKNNTASFKTREEAVKAGFRPCKICKP